MRRAARVQSFVEALCLAGVAQRVAGQRVTDGGNLIDLAVGFGFGCAFERPHAGLLLEVVATLTSRIYNLGNLGRNGKVGKAGERDYLRMIGHLTWLAPRLPPL